MIPSRIASLFVGTAIISVAGACQAAVVIPTYGDSLVNMGNSASVNNGRPENYLRVRNDGSEFSAAIIGFDLAGNNSADYSAASLLFNRHSNASSGTLTVWGVVTSVSPENFDEATVTHNNAPGLGVDKTFNASNTNLFALGSFAVAAAGAYTYTFDTDDLQFLNSHRQESGDSYVTFYLTTNSKGYLDSKESGGASNGPRLSVTAVPEPAAIGVLGAAMTGLLRRRRAR